MSQLFTDQGKPTGAYEQPANAVKTLIHGADYLDALRQTPGALGALWKLTGQAFPEKELLAPEQLKILFEQLFGPGEPPPTTLAYDDPKKAAQNMARASTYLDTLRQTPGALDAIFELTGRRIPASGKISGEDLDFLFEQLFSAAGETLAYSSPEAAVQNLIRAAAYLRALRQTPGALQAMNALIGWAPQASGPLSGTELEKLVLQLFNDKGPTLAYSDPRSAIEHLIAAARYLDALRGTSGALEGFMKSTGMQLPTRVTLNPDNSVIH